MTTTNTINSATNTNSYACGGYASLADAMACINSNMTQNLNACTNSNIVQSTNTTIDPEICNTNTTIPSWTTDTYTIKSQPITISTNVITKDNLEEEVEKYLKKHFKKKEDKTNMKNIFGQFGAITDGTIALSIKGMAVRNPAGKYVAYDADAEEMYDVDILHFDIKTPIFFKVPVAISTVEFGDIIIHNDSHYCYVIDGDSKQFTVIDITTSEQRVILPQKSPFGFNFVTKVISLMNPGTTADKDNPFGNIMPMMMLAGNLDSKDMLPFLLMNKDGMDFQKNPMLLYFLMKENNDMLPFLLMNSDNFKF